jgi:hypothetical protein
MAAPVPQTNKLTALQNLQNQLPVASQRVAQGIQAARDIQLQQAVAKAPTGAAIAPAAQQTAAAAVQQTGQQQAQAAQQMVQQAGQVGQLELGEQKMSGQQAVFGAQQAAEKQELDNVQRLSQLDMNAKKELYDNEISFKRDEAGRTLFNQRQLADYAKQNTISDEQFKNYAQQAEQVNKRNLQAMESAYNIIAENLKQQSAIAEQNKDQAAKKQIQEIQIELQKRMAKARARAANNMGAWTAAGTIAGAGAGALIAGPGGYAAGAAVGASVGGALGSYAGSQQGG